MISKRLKHLADFVLSGGIVCDVGTDHGLLPIYLLENKDVDKIIATDISDNSLQKLRDKLIDDNAKSKIFPFVMDGLSDLKDENIKTIVIAGMGEHEISKILLDSLSLVMNASRLILSVRDNAYILRKFLLSNDFFIIHECPMYENDKYYEVIIAVHKNRFNLLHLNQIYENINFSSLYTVDNILEYLKNNNFFTNNIDVEDIDIEEFIQLKYSHLEKKYGRLNLFIRNSSFCKRIEEEYNKFSMILDKMSKENISDDSQKEIVKKIEELNLIKNEII